MNKKLKEVALHEKDTGSSEAQIALLTDKIENLSANMKKLTRCSNYDDNVPMMVIMFQLHTKIKSIN